MKRLALALTIVLMPLPALAGTTGSLSGTVVEAEGGAPIADAEVVATSATQVEATRTDARGHFSFISLSPGEYTVAAERAGFNTVTFAGVTIFADASLHLPIMLPRLTIVMHYDGPPSRLIKHGTVSDIYSYSNAWVSLFPQVQSDHGALRLTPGITFGAGAPMMH